MIGDHQLHIAPDGQAYAITLDGHDIARMCTALTLRIDGGTPIARLTLDIPVLARGITVDGLPVHVELSEQTRDELTRLGWTPPA
jgi:hypothetical protein